MALEQDFDLMDGSNRDYRNKRATRWEFGIFAVVFVLAAIIILSYQLIIGTFHASLRISYGLSYIVPAAASIVCWYTFARTGPGSVRLVLDRVGVRFLFPSGREFRAAWNGLRFRVTLIDYRRSPLAQKLGVPSFARLRGFPDSPLTREAFDALIAAAEEHRQVIRVRKYNSWWRGDTRDEIEIRSTRP